MLNDLLVHITWTEVIDWMLTAYLIYLLYQIVKGTVAIRIFIGIGIIYLLWKVVSFFHLKLLSEILGQFIGVGVIALIIVFQKEIRQFLINLGNTGFLKRFFNTQKRLVPNWNLSENEPTNIHALAEAVKHMSRTRTGSLIVISRKSRLDEIIHTGIHINGDLTKELIETIFMKGTPLHDGAIIIKHNKIIAARCILPTSESPNLPETFGLRHRAATGLTENTDAIAIVVSEETGEISLFFDNEKYINISTIELEEKLRKLTALIF
ncbi:MAG: TIGR00159 family protein [Bacteroidetes bacterium]|nr:MAG: TIGR00159 family protein [Bacteroidota bacterium]